jgi:hypothetical protein
MNKPHIKRCEYGWRIRLYCTHCNKENYSTIFSSLADCYVYLRQHRYLCIACQAIRYATAWLNSQSMPSSQPQPPIQPPSWRFFDSPWFH